MEKVRKVYGSARSPGQAPEPALAVPEQDGILRDLDHASTLDFVAFPDDAAVHDGEAPFGTEQDGLKGRVERQGDLWRPRRSPAVGPSAQAEPRPAAPARNLPAR